jgi:hypothetical protein
MRKILGVLFVALAVAAGASSAHAARYERDSRSAAPAEAATGAVAGTAVGLGVSEGWWGSAVAGAALPTTVAGAAAIGGVAGIGTVALIDAAVQPCRGFQALLGMNQEYCAELNARQLRQAQRAQRVSSRDSSRRRHYAQR